MTAGIDNVKEVVKGMAKFATHAGKVFEDGKVSVSDLSELVAALPTLATLAQVDFEAAYAEVKDLSPEEAQALADLFSEYFKLPNQSLEAKIEAGLKYVKTILEAVKTIKEIYEAVKK